MYKIAEIRQGELPRLSELPIKSQKEIVAEVGTPLDLLKTYGLLKQATDNFQKKDDIAQELDSKLVTLLTKKGFYKSDSGAAPKEPTATPKKKSEKQKAQELIDDLSDTLEFLEGDDLVKTQTLISDLKETLEFLD
jgi:hypothetical protein